MATFCPPASHTSANPKEFSDMTKLAVGRPTASPQAEREFTKAREKVLAGEGGSNTGAVSGAGGYLPYRFARAVLGAQPAAIRALTSCRPVAQAT